jgi:hypothetical protein
MNNGNRGAVFTSICGEESIGCRGRIRGHEFIGNGGDREHHQGRGTTGGSFFIRVSIGGSASDEYGRVLQPKYGCPGHVQISPNRDAMPGTKKRRPGKIKDNYQNGECCHR